MRKFKWLILFLSLLPLLLAGVSCTSAVKQRVTGPKKIVEPGDEVLKAHEEEIRLLYSKLKIRSLDEIPEEKYSEFRQYAHNGSANVLVHPSYFLFFHDNNERKIVVERKDGNFSKNIVDLFIDEYPVGDSTILKRMRTSEKRERDFIKKTAAAGKLLILVLPPNYLNHPEYPYRKLDEFARYLNDATGGAPSVIYVESEQFKRGYVNTEVLARMNKLLNAAGVNTLLLGGGYTDQCLKDFQDEMARIQDIESVDLVPEICTPSPDFIE